MSNLKNPRLIPHGREEESYYCRQCEFNGFGKSGTLKKALSHSKTTGHTVDVYYETWREVTCYKKSPVAREEGESV